MNGLIHESLLKQGYYITNRPPDAKDRIMDAKWKDIRGDEKENKMSQNKRVMGPKPTEMNAI